MQLMCVHCGGPLKNRPETRDCASCGRSYPAHGGVPVLLPHPDRHVDATRRALLAERMSFALAQTRFAALKTRRQRMRALIAARIANVSVLGAAFFRAYPGTGTPDPAPADFLFQATTGWAAARLVPYFIADWAEQAASAEVHAEILHEALLCPDRKAAAVIGAGAGGLVAELGGHFDDVLGLDLSLPAMLLAHDLVAGGSVTLRPERDGGDDIMLKGMAALGNVTLAAANGAHLPLADGALSLVVTQYLLDVTSDPCAIAHEVHRCLAPGGLWVNLGLPFRLRGDPAEADRWTDEDMGEFLGNLGFTVQKADALVLPHLDLSAIDPAWNGEVHRVTLFRAARGTDPAVPRSLWRSVDPAAVPRFRPAEAISIERVRDMPSGSETAARIRPGNGARAHPAGIEACRMVEEIAGRIDGTRTVAQILAQVAEPQEAMIVLEHLLATAVIEI